MTRKDEITQWVAQRVTSEELMEFSRRFGGRCGGVNVRSEASLRKPIRDEAMRKALQSGASIVALKTQFGISYSTAWRAFRRLMKVL